MRVRLALVVLLFCGLLAISEAVDRSKFRTCENTGFCKRNRKLPDRGLSYHVQPATVQISGSSLTADIINVHNNHTFVLEMISHENGILRLKVDEKAPLRPRYKVQDVIMEDLKKVGFTKTSSTGHTATGHFGGSSVDEYHFRLHFAPFRLEVYVNNVLTTTTNGRNLFNIEHLRDKAILPPITQDNMPDVPAEDVPHTPEEAIDQAEHEIAPAPHIPESIPDQPPVSASELNKEDLTDAWEEYFGSHHDSKPNGPSSVSMDIAFPGAKHLYGLPEHTTGLSLRNTRGAGIPEGDMPYRLYNLDVFEYELDNTMALYGGVPIIMALDAEGRTSGVLWLNAAETFVDISEGTQSGKDSHWFSESGIVDVFFMMGPAPRQVFKQYAELTGTLAMPQMFAIAYHQCKWNYKDQADVAGVDGNFDQYDIPYDVIWLDIEHTDGKRYFTWDSTHFPSPTEMQDSIKAKGRKMVVIIDPHIKTDSGYHIHSEAKEKGLYIKNKDGQDYDGWCWPGSSSYLDFTNPDVRKWWGDKLSLSSYKGSTDILYVWNDMNEPSVFNGPEVSMYKDAVHHGGWEHRDVHNMYGYYMHMATSQGLVSRHPSHNDRSFVLSRAFFAGTQRHGAIWTGDNAAQWSHLAAAQPMLLSLGVGGIAFAGADVGGFFGNPEPELLTRWYQAGAYYPFFRAHAHLDSRRREPWVAGEPHTSIVRDAIRGRYALLPFWYTLFYENTQTGLPIMRPLWLEFPTDTNALHLDDEFLVGTALLVKPVSAANQMNTKVYLPGTGSKWTNLFSSSSNGADEIWYDYLSHTKHAGGQTLDVSTPLEKIPVFQRGGSIIPKKERVRRSSSQMTNDPYTIQIALNAKGAAEGSLYIDDGHSFDYKKGQYHLRNFTFSDNKFKSVSVGSNTCRECGAQAAVERVVVIGAASRPNKVTLTAKGATSTLDFDYNAATSVIVVRKPSVAIDQDFEIQFN
eukprot:TRINITY_DN2271_c0_g1_i2.p1 TRINITY_DN2271_c0_g1~~TRINITY_DN2271_c0_g1_i2.p1  ORF type:complete len:965 (-),score=270.56 TRINITY_DN2271_c0_g1_i2:59-2953(-)